MTTPLTDPDNAQFDIVDDTGFTTEQAVAFLEGRLNLDTLVINESSVDDKGVMIALRMTDYDANRLIIPRGEPASALHLTLFYLGNAADFSADTYAQVTDYCTRVANDFGLMEGNVFGAAIWNPDGNEPSIIVNVGGCDCFEEIHDAIGAGLPAVLGQPLPEQHSPWVPHVCLAYSGDTTLLETAKTRTGAIEFDRLRVAFGPQHTDIPLSGD
jgi:2'-5' RNA ligase